jgi:hypothetical protein
MKTSIGVTSFLLAVLCLSFTAGPRKQYCNERFRFCMEYPDGFKADGESANGDGQTFSALKGAAKIWAYAHLALDPRDLDENNDPDPLKHEFKTSTEGIKLAYKVMRPDYYIFSGANSNGDIVYCKTARHKINYMGNPGSEVLQSIMIIYPAAEQEKYKDYCTYIAGSLK